MSQHRQHYFEANFFPENAQQATEHSVGRAVAIGALVVACLGTALSAAKDRLFPEPPVVTPVRSPIVQVYALPPMDVDEQRVAVLRAEAFRAGLQEGLAQQGCRPTLSYPITTR